MVDLNALRGGLIVSCQPVDDGPMDSPEIIAAMAAAAVAGGARGVRIEGVDNVAALRKHVDAPIIGIVKRDLIDSPVRITPWIDDVEALVRAGADIIACDATDRARPTAFDELARRVKSHGRLLMADCSDAADGERAQRAGADILGTTLSGYTDATAGGDDADYDLIGRFRSLGSFVMAEGRINTPERALKAMMAGADSVTVGTALTRLEVATGWFVDAISSSN